MLNHDCIPSVQILMKRAQDHLIQAHRIMDANGATDETDGVLDLQVAMERLMVATVKVGHGLGSGEP